MSQTEQFTNENGFHWWIRRNPLYLLSAVAMALGARWLLVHPDATAGDVGLILATLGVLQLYECLVSAVLIVLHRYRRSPEDLPSLMMVGALFWTGPLAATVEMTARQGSVGLAFAIAAGVIALGELHVVRRTLGLKFSPWGNILTAACILLLVAAPWKLHVPHATQGTDEAALYLCWWILSGIVLLGIGGLHWQDRRRRAVVDADAARRMMTLDIMFFATVVTATAVHLWGMNYAFFGNARLFYVVPLLGAASLAWYEYQALRGTQKMLGWIVGIILPILGIILARTGFHEKVGVSQWPLVLRDPLLTALVVASVVWWYGAVRRGPTWLLHFGLLGVAAVIGKTFSGMSSSIEPGEILRAYRKIPSEMLAGLFFGWSAYLLLFAWWRRSRWEALAALVTTWLGTAYAVYDKIVADELILTLMFGWFLLVAVHLSRARTPLAARVLPLLLIVLVNAAGLRDPSLRYYAAVHTALMSIGLFIVGWIWPWTRYRAVAIVHAGMLLVLAGGRWISGNPHAKAIGTIVAAFGLMGLGFWVSWHKTRWLSRSQNVVLDVRTQPVEETDESSFDRD